MKSRLVFTVLLVVMLVTSMATPLAVAQRPEEMEAAPVQPAAAPAADCTWVELLVEDFESWPPADWTIVDYGGDCVWESTATTGRNNETGGDGYAADADSGWCGSGTTMNTGLQTPHLDLSDALTATLQYVASYFHVGGHSAAVNFNASGTWTNLLTWTESHPAESVTLNLPVGDPDALVEFHYLAPSSHKWYMVDEVIVSACVVELPEFPIIVVEPPDLNAELCAGEGMTIDLSICNQGGPPLEWQVEITETLTLVDWLSADPITGTVPAGECQEVGVTFDATGLDPRDYLADLLITSNDPETPEVMVPVTMTVPAPVEIVEVNYGLDGLTVTFDSDVVGGEPILYTWTFGDGNTSSDPDPEHTYAEGGWYTVTLVVENACGTDDWTEAIYIEPLCEPAVILDVDYVVDGLTVTLTSEVGGSEPIDYGWDLGDTYTSTLPNPIHTYAEAGWYTVTLTVENACGMDEWEKAIYVGPLCEPVEIITVTYAIEGLGVVFSSEVTGTAPIDYWWEFGDGQSSTDPSPEHTYAAGGWYTVTLEVENACGTDEWEQAIYVEPVCVPVEGVDFTWEPEDGIVGEEILFTAVITTGTEPYTYTWDFGDGSTWTGTAFTATHTYTAADVYTVTLTVNNCGGLGEAEVWHWVTVESGVTGVGIYLPVVLKNF